MLKTLLATLLTVVLVAVPSSTVPASAAAPQAKPRQQTPPPEDAGERRDPEGASKGRAVPRPPAPPEREGQRRRATPPPRVVPPPAYYRVPRPYYFPPVHVQSSFYYHPYFGFYYGPYYGPYYPYPGPTVGPARYTASALRTRVRPNDAEVYINGYYAGHADDFDGLFQRLYLPAGGHTVEFHLAGYLSFSQKLYLQPGDVREIDHQMVPTDRGTVTAAPTPHGPLPSEWRESAAPVVGDRPASPFGILAIRVEPNDAEILVDRQPWLGTGDLAELVLHVPAGWHQLEIRKEGYQTFTAEVELSEGATTRLNVRLSR